MLESDITSKRQVTLPKVVMKVLGVEPGDRIRYTLYDGEVRIRPILPINRLYGIVQYEGSTVTLDDMDRAISDAVG